MSNNFETVKDTLNLHYMSMKHDYATGVALSLFLDEKSRKAPLGEEIKMTSYSRLAIKPRYLGNHASPIKSCDASLSLSHGRLFRIRHENSLESLLGGEIMMTSYPACNKTSLSRKPYIADKKLLWIIIMKSYGRSFRIRYEKVRAANPGGELTIMLYPVGNITSLSRKPCTADTKLLLNTFMKFWPHSNLKKQQILFFKNLTVYKCC